MKSKVKHFIERHGDDFAVCGHLENRDCTALPNHVTCPECKAKLASMGLSTSLENSQAVRDMCRVK